VRSAPLSASAARLVRTRAPPVVHAESLATLGYVGEVRGLGAFGHGDVPAAESANRRGLACGDRCGEKLELDAADGDRLAHVGLGPVRRLLDLLRDRDGLLCGGGQFRVDLGAQARGVGEVQHDRGPKS
jgi:hypothetical protein